MARLTMAALRRTGAEALLRRCLPVALADGQDLTPQDRAAALAFLEAVSAAATAPPAAQSVARFERALVLAGEAAVASELDPEAVPFREVVPFPAPAVEVLGALLTGAPMPDLETPLSYVLIDSRLPELWRPIPRADLMLYGDI
jgi:hypothetical protein